MRLLDILSLIGSLFLIAGVLVLTYYATRWYAKRMGHMHGQGRYIRLVDRTAVSQGASVCVIKVGERYYLLGAGDKSVTMLTELEGFVEEPREQLSAELPFRQIYGNFIDRFKKP